MNISVLGSTGSVGKNALEAASIIGASVRSISVNRGIGSLCSQIELFAPEAAVITDEECYKSFISEYGEVFKTARILCGKEGLDEIIRDEEVQVIVNAISGIAGLRPTISALSAGKKIATANKESIVMGWHLIEKLVEYPGQLVPVDSEHSAVFQMLEGVRRDEVKKILLTASGGAVYGRSAAELESVTAADCLAHPTWDMGDKITVDSATLMNKGLEVIEACNIFGVSYDMVDVMIHPQSVVHALLELADGCLYAHLAPADMKIPISYAISHPGRVPMPGISLRLEDISKLEFFSPDRDKFPCLDLAEKAGRAGGASPVLLCAADDAAVGSFLEGGIKFTDIPEIIERVLEKDIRGSLESAEGIEDVYRKAYKAASAAAGVI